MTTDRQKDASVPFYASAVTVGQIITLTIVIFSEADRSLGVFGPVIAQKARTATLRT